MKANWLALCVYVCSLSGCRVDGYYVGIDGRADGDANLPDSADAPGRPCDPDAPFGTPTLVPNISSSLAETGFSMTGDGLTAFVTRETGQMASDVTLSVSRRTSVQDDFPAPAQTVELSAVSAVPGTEYWPWPASDGLVLYFHRQDSSGVYVSVAQRGTSNGVFSAGSHVNVDGFPIRGLGPKLSPDGKLLYWVDYDELKLYSTQNSGTPDNFAQRHLISTMMLSSFALSSDTLTLYYGVYSGASGTSEIFASVRSTKDVPFGIGLPAPNLNSTADDKPLFVTPDGCSLFLVSNRTSGAGGYDIWVARRPQ